jgi:hypothetical protein
MDWHKHRKNGLDKVDSKAVLKKYHDQKTEELINRMKNSYRSQLIGRLGDFNPQLDSERRLSYHYKLRDLNYESFEDLSYMRQRHKIPEVRIDRKRTCLERAGGWMSACETRQDSATSCAELEGRVDGRRHYGRSEGAGESPPDYARAQLPASAAEG